MANFAPLMRLHEADKLKDLRPNGHAIGVLVQLCAHADAQGIVGPNRKEMIEICGISSASFDRQIIQLIEINCIQPLDRKPAGGPFPKRGYQLEV